MYEHKTHLGARGANVEQNPFRTKTPRTIILFRKKEKIIKIHFYET